MNGDENCPDVFVRQHHRDPDAAAIFGKNFSMAGIMMPRRSQRFLMNGCRNDPSYFAIARQRDRGDNRVERSLPADRRNLT
jgi:hypothetical protein